MADPKDIAAMIVEENAQAGLGEEDELLETEMDEGQMAAVEDVMDAVKSGDTKLLAAALRAFVQMSL